MKQLESLQDTCEGDYKLSDTSHSYIRRTVTEFENAIKFLLSTVKQWTQLTYSIKSSVQIASHRLNEELFVRIPLKAFGGAGKFGRQRLTTSTELTPFSCPSEFRKVLSLIPPKDSARIHLSILIISWLAKNRKWGKWNIWADGTEVPQLLQMNLPCNSFPPIAIYSFKRLPKSQLRGCYKIHLKQ